MWDEQNQCSGGARLQTQSECWNCERRRCERWNELLRYVYINTVILFERTTDNGRCAHNIGASKLGMHECTLFPF